MYKSLCGGGGWIVCQPILWSASVKADQNFIFNETVIKIHKENIAGAGNKDNLAWLSINLPTLGFAQVSWLRSTMLAPCFCCSGIK